MTIQHLLKRNAIPLRKTTPWKNKYNIRFFSEYNPQSCYWAGFILADGCLRSDRATLSIKLADKDKEHLEKFARAISFSGTIKHDNYQCSIVDVNGKWPHQQLQELFDICPQKTFTTKLTNKVPLEHLHHFVRGILDGDGCICVTSVPMVSIAGTIQLLEELSWLFYGLGVRLRSQNDVPPVRNRSKNGISQLSYGSANAKLILDWLYAGSSKEIRLDRKYDRYLKLFC